MKNPDTKPTLIGIDELIAEKLSQNILSHIEHVTIEISDVTPHGFLLKITKKVVKFNLSGEISTKKLITLLGTSFTAILGASFTFLNWLFPILLEHFHKAPP